MRRQWTQPIRVFPDFSEWRKFVKIEQARLESEKLLDISNDHVGVLRANTKFSFPSDNSVIRVDKFNVGQRRTGESKIIKDNFTFGIREKKDVNNQKVQDEDALRNADAKSKQDRSCDFWLLFDTGVRLNVEMQDHQEPNMELIPPNDMSEWLKQKIEREKKQQQEVDEKSDSQVRKSQLAVDDAIDVLDGSAQLQGAIEDSKLKDANKAAESKDPEEAAQDEKPQEEPDNQEDKAKENAEEEIVEEDDPELKNPNIEIDGHDMTVGTKLTFTFDQGLVV